MRAFLFTAAAKPASMARFACLAAVACLLGCALPGTGRAGMITYTETYTGTGSLGTTNFTDAMVTLTGTGDTANVTGTTFIVNSVTATVNVAGVGTANFTTGSIGVLVEPTAGQAGFESGLTEGLFVDDSSFASYDLKTAIGPVTNDLIFGFAGATFSTDQGTFQITNFSGQGTFTATTAAPEPASLTLLGLGVAGIAGYAWRRRR
jgi:hypothetical protein